MARKTNKKQRDNPHRKTNPVILMIAEGTNETEFQYFHSFQHQYAGYTIRILKTGHKTDPAGMLRKIEDYWIENDYDSERGDVAFVIVDLDCDEEKAKLIAQLTRESKYAQFTVSNPCFEVWFLLHFRYSTKAFLSSKEVLNELKQYIPDYQKNTGVSEQINPFLKTAMDNAQKLIDFHRGNGNHWPSNECNPRTDVNQVVSEIMKRGTGGTGTGGDAPFWSGHFVPKRSIDTEKQ